jgi:hypothetical protein
MPLSYVDRIIDSDIILYEIRLPVNHRTLLKVVDTLSEVDKKDSQK